MATRKENLIGAAMVAALGVGTLAAIRYNRQFLESANALRGQILGMVASHINYAELAQQPGGLASYREQIPGSWRISSVWAEILADQQKGWFQIYGSGPSPVSTETSSFQQYKPCDPQYLRGLYVYQETTDPPPRAQPTFYRDVRDIARMAKVTNWLVGEAYLPGYLLREITR